MLRGVVIVVVAGDEPACERVAGPLRAAGAAVSCALPNVDALAILGRPGFDVVVLQIARESQGFLPLAGALREEGRLRGTVVVGLAEGGVDEARVGGLGLDHVTTDGPGLPVLLASLLPPRGFATAAERGKLEEDLRLALARMASLRAEGQTLAHDGRALCGIVLGFAANLRDCLVGRLTDAQATHVHEIIEAATDMGAMLERFGRTVRTEVPPRALSAPPLPLQRTARRTLIDLSEIALAMGRAFAEAAQREGVTLEVDAPAPVRIWGDALQLKQVVVNLVANAIKFTPPNGHVKLSARSRTPEPSREGAAARTYAELTISDTGPGIPVEDRERIFGRGVRLERDGHVAGSGLGLAVAQEIATSHGGDIRAGASESGGASFVVHLPVDMRTRRDAAAGPLEEPEGSAAPKRHSSASNAMLRSGPATGSVGS